ncbi:MAG: tetratricopeptide repeat protein, partial [Pseudomonadota bacterium]
DPWLAAVLVQASKAHSTGDLDSAENGYRQVLSISPSEPNALHLLGLVLGAKGRFQAGRHLIEKAIVNEPNCAFFHSNLGNLLQREGKIAAAIDAYGHAIRLDPSLADAHANLAGALAASCLYVGAEMSAERALEIVPEHPIALANLAGARIGQLRFDQASQPLEAARRLAPHSPDVWLNTGHLRMAENNYQDSEAAFRRALELAPDMIEAKRGLGFVLARRSKLSEARPLLEAYVAACGDQPSNAHTMLGHVLMLIGDYESALPLMRRGLSRDSVPPHEFSTVLFDLNYCPELSPAEVLAEHRRWAERYAIDGQPLHTKLDRDPDRRLRIGFVSPDFRAHSVSFFFQPLIECFDSAGIETVCYSNVRDADQVTLAIQQAADEWREIWGIDDRAVAETIRNDRIDILVDLAGHSADNRLGVFRFKAAPLQVSYLGYPNTTGLDTVDVRLVDQWTDPKGTDSHASEKLLRLNRCFLAYRPAMYPAITEPPSIKNGFVTFGSFNNFAKINDQVLGTWAQVLQAVPDSKLVLKHDVMADPVVKGQITVAFEAAGIDPDRVTLLNRTPDLVSHLECYGQTDIALDTFPYNGTTTSCEALWMGVPVVTLAGNVHAARVGESLLSSIGFDAGITRSVDEYCETAIMLAANPAMLSAIRTMLRDTMMSSPLCDGEGLARAIEQEFRNMWQSWCAADQRGERE